MAVLKAICGHAYGRIYPVCEPRCYLGRGEDCHVSDVFEGFPGVGRRHAQIEKADDNFTVRDLDSLSGTWLNGNRITEPTNLRDGDCLSIGGNELLFYQSDPSPQIAVGSEATELTRFFDSTEASTIDFRIAVAQPGGHELALANVRLQALLDMLSRLGGSLDLNEVLHGVLQSLLTVFGEADRGFIGLRDPDGGPPIPTAVLHRHEDQRGEVRVSRTIANEVMRTNEAILSEDATTDEHFDGVKSIPELSIRSMMCAPLVGPDGSALGILQLDTQEGKGCFQKEDLKALVPVSRLVSVALQYSKLHEQVVRRQAMERDLAVARQVQESLLPRAEPDVAGYEFYRFYQPAYEVGGDYYDFLPLPDGRWAVIVADAVGKGVSAALLMTILSVELKSALARRSSPSDALKAANSRLTDLTDGGSAVHFVTLVMVVIDPSSSEVDVLNAGHFEPFLRRRNGVLELPGTESKGLPLGIDSNTCYGSSTLKIENGESLVLFSDGITDAMNVEEKPFGLNGLEKSLTSATVGGASQLGQYLVEKVQRFVGGHPQFDDMCLVCIHHC